MQKGEWLPFSLLSAFCILHSAFPLKNWAAGLTLPPKHRRARSANLVLIAGV